MYYRYSNYFYIKNNKKNINNIFLPSSKSISNRILLFSCLIKKYFIIKNLLISNDILVMINCLKKIGIKFFFNLKKNIYLIYKKKYKYFKNNILFTGNSGTTLRPLLTFLSFLNKKNFILYGLKYMYKRPIKNLVDILNNIGINIKYIKNKNYPPIYIKKSKILNINLFKIKGNISSQFLTSILISSVLISKKNNIIIELLNNLVSKTYIYLTINLMRFFGIKIYEYNNFKIFIIKNKQKYISPVIFNIEGDASSATYFLSAAFILKKNIRIYRISKYTIQGDLYFINILYKLGLKIFIKNKYIEIFYNKNYLNCININCNDIPDASMTLAILTLFLKNKSILYNIENWCIKESNRLNIFFKTFKKLGILVFKNKNYLIIVPPKKINSIFIKTYNDHRIAMCFSLVSLGKKNKRITFIQNPECVYKTFPDFFYNFKYNIL